MQIIFGEKCVLLLRLFFAAVLMLWCAQTAAYSGQCHTTQGNPYIGVNFGVKTLEEEENTAGVVKDKFYQWNESNDYYVSCDCDKDNVRSGRWAFAADSPLVYLGSFRKRGHRGRYTMAYLRSRRSTFRWPGG